MKFTTKPEYSKNRVNRAGNAVRNNCEDNKDIEVIENWRASHAYVLNTFQATLRRHAQRYQNVTVAQRLKRKATIYDKLRREAGMSLARMHDIAGCRLIVDDVKTLRKLRARMYAAKFKHQRRNDTDSYDYLKNPKPNGYRGVHDVYKYVSFSGGAAEWDGLLFELQYRTKVQHAWATAVEIAGSVTGNEPKFDRGNQAHIEFFKVCSELLARHHEDATSCCPDHSLTDLKSKYHDLERETGLMRLLDSLVVTRQLAEDKKHLILRFSNESGEPKIRYSGYNRSKVAILQYFNLEAKYPDDDIVLVQSDSNDGIRSAFRNYFSDAEEFIALVKSAIAA